MANFFRSVLSSARAILQNKTATPTTSVQVITPDSGYDGLAQVTVNAVNLQSKTTTMTPPSPSSWSATTTKLGTVTPDNGYTGLSQADISIPMIPDNTTLSLQSSGSDYDTYTTGRGGYVFSNSYLRVPKSGGNEIKFIVNGDRTYVPTSKGSLTTVSTSGNTMTIKNGTGAVANEYFAFNVNLYQLVHQVFGPSVTSVKFTITNYSYTHTLASRTLGLKSSAGKYDGSGFAFDSQGSSVSFTVDVESTLNSYKYLGTGAQDGKQCSFDSITISKVA